MKLFRNALYNLNVVSSVTTDAVLFSLALVSFINSLYYKSPKLARLHAVLTRQKSACMMRLLSSRCMVLTATCN